MDFHKTLVEKSVSLSDFKKRFNELRKDHDITFYAYILKIISNKNNANNE